MLSRGGPRHICLQSDTKVADCNRVVTRPLPKGPLAVLIAQETKADGTWSGRVTDETTALFKRQVLPASTFTGKTDDEIEGAKAAAIAALTVDLTKALADDTVWPSYKAALRACVDHKAKTGAEPETLTLNSAFATTLQAELQGLLADIVTRPVDGQITAWMFGPSGIHVRLVTDADATADVVAG
jgi:hypothetical protein